MIVGLPPFDHAGDCENRKGSPFKAKRSRGTAPLDSNCDVSKSSNYNLESKTPMCEKENSAYNTNCTGSDPTQVDLAIFLLPKAKKFRLGLELTDVNCEFDPEDPEGLLAENELELEYADERERW